MEKREEKNKLPLIIGGVAAAVVVIIVILFVIPGKNHTDTDLAKVVELSSFTNGFADWEADGTIFCGSDSKTCREINRTGVCRK